MRPTLDHIDSVVNRQVRELVDPCQLLILTRQRLRCLFALGNVAHRRRE